MACNPRRATLGRRRFLGAAAAIAAAACHGQGISNLQAASATRETGHFWCRLAPEGPYIDSQRDQRAFGFGDGRIYLSDDNARTWACSSAFPQCDEITFSCLLNNGNVVFATRQQLFLSTDNLKSWRPIVVKDHHGQEFRPHSPRDPDQPGWYFHPLDGIHTWDVDGREMLVWGNYCNVVGGPAPANIFYSTDGGETVKIAYSFGRNPFFQEKGTPRAAFLGDPDNPVICRHIHNVVFNPAERAFYACTGDINRGSGNECHWLRGTYDSQADHWDWKVLISVDSNSRYKSGGINFVAGRLYWAADANGRKSPVGTYDRGIFSCNPAELTDPTKHTRLFNAEYEMAAMIIQDDVILAGYSAKASTYQTGFAISLDLGQTWHNYDLTEFGPRSPARFSPMNSEGWFRVDLRKGWIERAEVLFIKPKRA